MLITAISHVYNTCTTPQRTFCPNLCIKCAEGTAKCATPSATPQRDCQQAGPTTTQSPGLVPKSAVPARSRRRAPSRLEALREPFSTLGRTTTRTEISGNVPSMNVPPLSPLLQNRNGLRVEGRGRMASGYETAPEICYEPQARGATLFMCHEL